MKYSWRVSLHAQDHMLDFETQLVMVLCRYAVDLFPKFGDTLIAERAVL